jgi:hypothetical protein
MVKSTVSKRILDNGHVLQQEQIYGIPLRIFKSPCSGQLIRYPSLGEQKINCKNADPKVKYSLFMNVLGFFLLLRYVSAGLPTGPIIAGYAPACDDNVTLAVQNGVNVVYWFASSLLYNSTRFFVDYTLL